MAKNDLTNGQERASWKVSIAETTAGGSFSLQNVSRNGFQVLINYFPAKIAISSKPCVRSVPAAFSNLVYAAVPAFPSYNRVSSVSCQSECFGKEFTAALASSS